MEINTKQFLTDDWYNKYSSALSIAILNTYNKKTGIKLIYKPDEFNKVSENLYQKLIEYSHNPSNEKVDIIQELDKISKEVIDFNLKSIRLVLDIIEYIIKKGEEDEYLNLSIIIFQNKDFHILSGIGDNMKKNIGILQTLITAWYGRSKLDLPDD